MIIPSSYGVIVELESNRVQPPKKKHNVVGGARVVSGAEKKII